MGESLPKPLASGGGSVCGREFVVEGVGVWCSCIGGGVWSGVV